MDLKLENQIKQDGILNFQALKQDEIMIIHFDNKLISPDLIHRFSTFWTENGFSNFVICPTTMGIGSKEDVIRILESQIEKVKSL